MVNAERSSAYDVMNRICLFLVTPLTYATRSLTDVFPLRCQKSTFDPIIETVFVSDTPDIFFGFCGFRLEQGNIFFFPESPESHQVGMYPFLKSSLVTIRHYYYTPLFPQKYSQNSQLFPNFSHTGTGPWHRQPVPPFHSSIESTCSC
jgi:hypothetical protein